MPAIPIPEQFPGIWINARILNFGVKSFSMLLRSLVIIFGFLAIGEVVVAVSGLKFPSSIIGMLLLTLALHKGWIKESWVRGIADLLVGHLGLLFVPPAVGVMQYFGLIGQSLAAFIVAVVVSLFVVMAVSGYVFQVFKKKE